MQRSGIENYQPALQQKSAQSQNNLIYIITCTY
ncbi:hypothetical protein F383_02824 [Gossypium arboreum]|uniref:Uncharacterized protein n=1 Tax=Gossypium arboreum TaxID=29729 RepID=A0A0B0MR52_GOSAR|nr:hypothetical protein F383_02824 [Gossypium arboreum]